jgi:hypothetical protein
MLAFGGMDAITVRMRIILGTALNVAFFRSVLVLEPLTKIR